MANEKKMLAAVVHLTTNLWREADPLDKGGDPLKLASGALRCDEALLDEYAQALAAAGVNTLILDLGDAIAWQTHPEIAVENAWSVERLRQKLASLRAMGFALIPMLNFSTAHDMWLGDAAHMIATVPYYKVCTDLIREVCQIFDYPADFHLGWEEESYKAQEDMGLEYIAVRHMDQWWHDFYLFVDRVQGEGARAIFFADKMWENPDEFIAQTPTKVVVCHRLDGNSDADRLACCQTLEENGYDQLVLYDGAPDAQRLEQLKNDVEARITPAHLLGYAVDPLAVCLPERREAMLQTAQTVSTLAKE